MTFTEEQIRKAIARTAIGKNNHREDLADHIIAELTRPQPEFREGEVVGIQRTEDSKEWTYANFPKYKTYCPIRKLRLSEMPEVVERIRYTIAYLADYAFDKSDRAKAQEALADFDREISDEKR